MRAFGVVLLTAGCLFAAQVPRPAPEFGFKMAKGGQTSISQYRGKVVCMEFLYTTCSHCQEASRIMSRLQTEYGPKGFQALGVGFNEMAGMLVDDFVREFKVNYPVGYSERGPVHAFLQNDPNNVLHVPQLVFIDRKGVIRHQSLPRGDGVTAVESNMRKWIETLLAEPSGKAPPRKKAS